ncbi:unnamed protein product [Phaedon cochleariae]|uniref:Uncharacterized protein n=1 Tax=Phaedon cochleariae TaxID=80249 RepID=A0A9N9WZU4_PHACE|nr:unnamed protein product [Phaedon cochleariae]
MDADLLLLYYFGYVQSCLSYAIMCWGSCARADEGFRAQKRIIRIILFKSFTFSCTELSPELNLLTFPSLFILASMMQVKNNLSEYAVSRNNQYDLRVNMDMTLPKHRLTIKVANGPFLPN